MRLFYGLLIFVCAGQYVCGVDNNANANSNNKSDKTANKPNNDPSKPVSETKSQIDFSTATSLEGDQNY